MYSLDPPPSKGPLIEDLLCPQLFAHRLIELMVDQWLEPRTPTIRSIQHADPPDTERPEETGGEKPS